MHVCMIPQDASRTVLLLRYETWRGLRYEMLTACLLFSKMQAYQKNAIACMTRTLSLRGTYL